MTASWFSSEYNFRAHNRILSKTFSASLFYSYSSDKSQTKFGWVSLISKESTVTHNSTVIFSNAFVSKAKKPVVIRIMIVKDACMT